MEIPDFDLISLYCMGTTAINCSTCDMLHVIPLTNSDFDLISLYCMGTTVINCSTCDMLHVTTIHNSG